MVTAIFWVVFVALGLIAIRSGRRVEARLGVVLAVAVLYAFVLLLTPLAVNIIRNI